MLTSEASEARWWRGSTAIRQLMSNSRARRESQPLMSTSESEEERIAGYLRLGNLLVRGREELRAAVVAAEEREPARAWRHTVDDELGQLAGVIRSASERLEQVARELERMQRGRW